MPALSPESSTHHYSSSHHHFSIPPYFSNSLEALGQLPAALKSEFQEAITLAQHFNDQVVRPRALMIDKAVMEDNDYLPDEVMRLANEWGLFTRWIPKMFGGEGMNMLSLYTFIEEVSSVCAGIANLIGVHYLGVSVLCASCHLRVIQHVLRNVVEESRRGKPCTLALAWTEPNAGSDQVEAPLLPGARVRTRASKVTGGYRVSGNKIFISKGHLASWFMLICYEDVKAPADTLTLLAVKAGSPGFTLGHKEHKMGQKACVASELIFEDCFVPDECVCYAPEQARALSLSPRETGLKVISLFPAVSQPGVAAIAAGIARAALEHATQHAAQTQVNGAPLLNAQWAQAALADMMNHAMTARSLYLEAAYAAGLHSMLKPLYDKSLFYLTREMPVKYMDRWVAPWLSKPWVNERYRRWHFSDDRTEETRYMAGVGAWVKVACSDLAMKNCAIALDLMGAEGTRHAHGVEKLLRDAKLLQIYEGTNEVNRINLVAQHMEKRFPHLQTFA